MKLPVIRGVIERRILVNYRVEPDALARTLPEPFRPKLFRGFGLAGICLIRLARIRPAFMPGWIGITSENAAHRTAVEWDDDGRVNEGVFVRRRDTSSRINALAGGRLFPGVHHHARFDVAESAERFSVAVQSDDGVVNVSVAGRMTSQLPANSVFQSVAEASAFFEARSLGYSATADSRRFDGLELRCLNWGVDPLEIDEVRSSFFDDRASFPQGTVEFDSALLMRNVDHEWRGQPDLCCSSEGVCGAPSRGRD